MKIAVVVGANGLVGSELVKILQSDPSYRWIFRVQRKNSPVTDRVTALTTDYSNLHNLTDLMRREPSDEVKVFCCLGTTKKKAKTKKAFEEVDRHLVIRTAEWVKKDLKAKHFCVVSVSGASVASSAFYLKIKGLMENDLKKLKFEQLQSRACRHHETRHCDGIVQSMQFTSANFLHERRCVPTVGIGKATHRNRVIGRPVGLGGDRGVRMKRCKNSKEHERE